MKHRNMKILALLLALVITGCAGTGKRAKWETSDTLLQGAGLVLLTIDAFQTAETRNQPGVYERNPILGEQPDGTAVATYFISSAIIHTAIAWLLDKPWRQLWQFGLIGVEGACVVNNNAR